MTNNVLQYHSHSIYNMGVWTVNVFISILHICKGLQTINQAVRCKVAFWWSLTQHADHCQSQPKALTQHARTALISSCLPSAQPYEKHQPVTSCPLPTTPTDQWHLMLGSAAGVRLAALSPASAWTLRLSSPSALSASARPRPLLITGC